MRQISAISLLAVRVSLISSVYAEHIEPADSALAAQQQGHTGVVNACAGVQ